MNEFSSEEQARKAVLSYLRADLARLRLLDVQSKFLEAFELIIRNSSIARPAGRQKKKNEVGTLPDANTLSLDEVVRFVEADDTPRSVLNDIAKNFFSVSNGSVRSIGSKSELVRKLKSLIEARKSHLSIERLASKQTFSDDEN